MYNIVKYTLKEVWGMIYKRKKFYGIINNKDIKFKKIDGIYIEKFRLFKEQEVELGNVITIFSGRNGSMKSSIMGLISHIYSTDSVSTDNKLMQTKLSEVFRLSITNDTDKYKYFLKFTDSSDNKISEPVDIFLNKEGTRHRIVASGHGAGDGNFHLCSVYLNLKRLLPLTDFKENDIKINNNIITNNEEKKFISKFYEKVLLRPEFNEHEHFVAKMGSMTKLPVGPTNSYYSVDALSSGEDNLGQIVDALLSFTRVSKTKDSNDLIGILSIDEFDASLHPIAQLNLFNFIYDWAKQHNVQVLMTSHSLFLLKEILFMKDKIDNDDIVVNFIAPGYKPGSELSILKNPEYKIALQELTLQDIQKEQNIKLNVLVEDEVANFGLKRILKSKEVTDRITVSNQFTGDKIGTSWTALKSFANNFSNILYQSMSIIVVDQDVEISVFKNFDDVLKLPSLTECPMPFEQELIYFIMGLDVGDEFFKGNNISKERIKQELSNNNIPLKPENLKDKSNLKNIKKWFNENKRRNKKLLTKMINRKENQDVYKEFTYNFVKMCNRILQKNGLPKIDGYEKN